MSKTRPGGTPSGPWWQGPRLEEDKQAVQLLRLPLELVVAENGRPLHWRGPITLVFGDREVTIDVEIAYRDGYPKVLPLVRDVAPRYTGDLASRHINSNHTFCLTPMTTGVEIATEGEGGFARFLQAVISFLVRQEKFEITGIWRGPAAEHGLLGQLKYHYDREFSGIGDWQTALRLIASMLKKPKPHLRTELRLKPGPKYNQPCPCESGRRYGACHKPVIEGVVEQCNATYYRWQ